MTPAEIDPILRATLADQRLTGSERKALAEWVAQHAPGEQQKALCRHRAFELAKAELIDPSSHAVLAWLEGVLKLLTPSATDSEASPPAEVYFSPDPRCPRRIAALFEQCRQRAEVCVFTITDDRISAAILDAHRRGVKLRLITDNEKAFDPGSDVERFRAAGIDLRIDQTAYHMHHKFALFDGTTLLNGSYNWTRGAAEYNEENYLITRDAHLVRTYAAAFEDLWQKLEPQ